MRKNQTYNKHKKRSHRNHRDGLYGMQFSKNYRPEPRGLGLARLLGGR